MAAPVIKWRELNEVNGDSPRPRHGHRAIAVKDFIVVFGGGNEGIVDEVHVFDTVRKVWSVPSVTGDVPPGCAAFGFVCDGSRILVFGGMLEYGRYTNDLHELQINKWVWRKIYAKPPDSGNPPPCPRLGHSFTQYGNKVYLFGGLANYGNDPKTSIPRYLGDLYVLNMTPRGNNYTYSWEVPDTNGLPPSARESHSCVAYANSDGSMPRLVLYGGMSGSRLGDIWLLLLDTLTWMQPTVSGIPPYPRSLHTAVVVGNKMIIHGGWVPVVGEDGTLALSEKEWVCSNSLGIFNLDTLAWEPVNIEEAQPKPRAGHCAAAVGSRMYVWSGRDGYKKAWNSQVCFNDLWYLETGPPDKPSGLRLVRAGTTTLEVAWNAVHNADAYLLQVQKGATAPPPPTTPVRAQQPVLTPVAVASSSSSVASANHAVQLVDAVKPATAAVATTGIVQSPAAASAASKCSLMPNKVRVVSPAGVRLVPSATVSGPRVVQAVPAGTVVGAGGVPRVIKTVTGGQVQQGQVVRLVQTSQGSVVSPVGVGQQVKVLPQAGVGVGGQAKTIVIAAPRGQAVAGSPRIVALPASAAGVVTQQGGPRKVVIVGTRPSANGQPRVSAVPVTRLPAGATRMPVVVQAGAAGAPRAVRVVTIPRASAPTPIVQRVAASNSSDEAAMAVSQLEMAELPLQLDGAGDDVDTDTEADDPSHEHQEFGGDAGDADGQLAQQQLAPSNDDLASIQQGQEALAEYSGQSEVDLAGLAEAALTQFQQQAASNPAPDEGEWYDITVTKALSYVVSRYHLLPNIYEANGYELEVNLTDPGTLPKAEIEPNTFYNFRLIAINSCGLSEESEVATMKSCVEGVPRAPTGVKITRNVQGANVSWNLPDPSSGEILEYTVYMALRTAEGQEQSGVTPASKLSFAPIYRGTQPSCLVPTETLASAHIDTSSKPAVIFRIAAKNKLNYGPATQARWILDSTTMATLCPPGSTLKRALTTDGSAAVGAKKGYYQ